MRAYYAVPMTVALLGCVNLPGLSESDAGSSSSGSAGSAADGGSGGGAATGSGCTQDLGGSVLCTQTSICPTLAIDHDKFPNCGFRIHGTAIDIECICDNELCPLGVPTTCAQASEMLDTQTETQVCTQLNDGRCTKLGSADAGTTKPGTCDKTCAGECGGDPSCMQLCGC